MIERSQELENIEFKIHPVKAHNASYTEKIDTRNIIPRLGIKKFNAEVLLLYGNSSLLYIMRRFPVLQHITLNREEKVFRDISKVADKILASYDNFISSDSPLFTLH